MIKRRGVFLRICTISRHSKNRAEETRLSKTGFPSRSRHIVRFQSHTTSSDSPPSPPRHRAGKKENDSCAPSITIRAQSPSTEPSRPASCTLRTFERASRRRFVVLDFGKSCAKSFRKERLFRTGDPVLGMCCYCTCSPQSCDSGLHRWRIDFICCDGGLAIRRWSLLLAVILEARSIILEFLCEARVIREL